MSIPHVLPGIPSVAEDGTAPGFLDSLTCPTVRLMNDQMMTELSCS